MSNKFNGEQYIGRKFGRLEVINVDKNKRWHVICKCECGNIKSIKYIAYLMEQLLLVVAYIKKAYIIN